MNTTVSNFEEIKTLEISSEAFSADEYIPAKYTCDGKNTNPPFSIKHLPEKAVSLVILVEDPDAPYGNFMHWMVWNIPATHYIQENFSKGVTGYNDFRLRRYNGPCPPSGIHHYHFKFYALDALLQLNPSASKTELEKEMASHIIAFGQLTGLYKHSVNY